MALADPSKTVKLSPGSQPLPTVSTFTPAAERAFVDAVLRNDRRSLEDFARRIACVPRLVAIRNGKMGRPLSGAELEDVVQDCFVVILRRLRDYQPIAPLESWVYGIVCLALRDAVRNKARGRRTAGELADEPPADGEQGLRQVADVAEIERALTGLGGLESQVLRLKYLEGLTFVELAERLGISPNTAKTLHYRGLARLRAQTDFIGDKGES